ncbi:MAG TPA: Zn-ribbon domain-containing OB-fold protein [Dehalococcoidia bacterium]|nr:Zn-ribbon domain-containing OB-fold protein [Dehalococcoidia bacterium]
MTSEYRKPVPSPSPEAEPYWKAAREHKLNLPFCSVCSEFFWFPRPFCPKCFSWGIEWRSVSGKGKLYTYAIQYRPQMPGFESELPYITAIVELDEGPRLMTNLVEVDADPAVIKCDMPVEVVFAEINDELALPKFRPVGGQT